jgi:2'-5' RNA ligase
MSGSVPPRSGLVQPSRGDAITIGLSIAIPEPFAGELQRWRERFGDPEAAAIPPHITIAPPTRLPQAQLESLEQRTAAVTAGQLPFTVRLCGADTFLPVSAVTFVQVTDGADECARLARALRSVPGLDEPVFPYHPHVTVAHGLSAGQLDEAGQQLAHYEAAFVVDGLWLYEYGDDGVWRARHRFPFTAADDGATVDGAAPGHVAR